MKTQFWLNVLTIAGIATAISSTKAKAVTDTFTFSGSVQISIPGVGTDTVAVSGPTSVTRSTVADTDANGLDEIQTEVVSMGLAGNSAMFGPVYLSESATRVSNGKIEESANIVPGSVDFPASSFFDVFVTIELSGLPIYQSSGYSYDPVKIQGISSGLPLNHGDLYVGPPQPVTLWNSPNQTPQSVAIGTLNLLTVASVPEPASAALLACGALLLLRPRRCKSRF
jgi:hypothetical protein